MMVRMALKDSQDGLAYPATSDLPDVRDSMAQMATMPPSCPAHRDSQAPRV